MNGIKRTTLAIVPGSFAPITNGHIFIVKEALKLYDKVILAVMINAEKTYEFSLEERTAIALAALKSETSVEVISYDGWLYKLANELKADAIVKGYRNDIDLKYEEEMAKFNKLHAPSVETVLIKTSAEFENVSSTLVRKKIANGETLKELLPKSAIDEINEILAKKNGLSQIRI